MQTTHASKVEDLSQPGPSASLSLWDTISIIIGIVIGAGVFETAPLIFATVNHAGLSLGVWVLGGLLSLIGALCYAELASTYPKAGGDYVYLSRSYGSWMGFLFGWSQLAVILTGSIGMMAYIFADYAVELFNLPPTSSTYYAIFSVLALAAMNALGVALGKRTQNFLSITKVTGLGLVVAAGFWAAFAGSGPDPVLTPVAAVDGQLGERGDLWAAISLALIFVLYTYGGWNDAAFVASEVQNRRRNIPRALILGIVAITAIYLLINLAYLVGLGLEGAKNSKAIAADLLRGSLGPIGADIMSLLVMISALSAVNGLIFTGSRIFSAMGSDHPLFGRLGHWNPQTRSPVLSILAVAVITAGLIAFLGSAGDTNRSGFENLLVATAPVFWLFFLLTGLSLFILRAKDPKRERPFRVPLYPWTPTVFCLTCTFMLYRSALHAGALGLWGFLLIGMGIPLYLFSKRLEARRQPLRPASIFGPAQEPS